MGIKRLAILGAAGILLNAAFPAAFAQTAPPLRVYAGGEITPDRYTVLKRLWVGEWRTAYEAPRHAMSGPAIGELVAAAARAGADGVVNLYCIEDPGETLQPAGFYCYGLAVKFRQR